MSEATLYYEAIQRSENTWGEFLPCDSELMSYRVDLRDGFLSKLSIIPQTMTVNPVWTIKEPFLWFMNSPEIENSASDYRAITRRKIDVSVPELRKIIDG